ncbi:hypothetical protein KY314_00265 [Candidatus Woesearchaeota archaeon]|nr:hypothetical protein [Candidatus Woesearchaeota archaeon]
MNTKTLKALKGSIKKWEDIRDGKGVDDGVENCPLCQLFWWKGCDGCPIYEKTGKKQCNDTPYIEWIKHQGEKHLQYSSPYKNRCPTCKKIAQKEVDFLKGLLPTNKKTMTFYEKLLKYLKAGRCPVVEDRDGVFYIFLKQMRDGWLRYGGGDTEEEAIDYLGSSYYAEENINEFAQEGNWKIIKSYHITELFPTKYEVGDKVRKINEGWIEKIEDMDNYYLEIKIDSMWWSTIDFEPYFPDEEEMIEIDGKKWSKNTIKEALKKHAD